MNFWRARVLQAVNSCPAPRSLQQLPVGGPTLLSLRPLQGSETVESVMLATNGIPQAAQPALWQPYDAARAVASTGLPLQALRTLPLLARKTAWTVLIDAESAQPVGFVAVDSF